MTASSTWFGLDWYTVLYHLIVFRSNFHFRRGSLVEAFFEAKWSAGFASVVEGRRKGRGRSSGKFKIFSRLVCRAYLWASAPLYNPYILLYVTLIYSIMYLLNTPRKIRNETRNSTLPERPGTHPYHPNPSNPRVEGLGCRV